MKLWSHSFDDGKAIPGKYAFAVPDAESHVALSDNLNPHLEWSGVPEGTRSLAIVCVDPDVPSVGDDVNQEGRTVPTDLKRVNFYHWLCVGLSPDVTSIAEGDFSKGIDAHGKPGPVGPKGTLQGLNDYTSWFAGDPEMEGDWFGYDGPCPPWNDERMHHYHFTVYALDTETLELPEKFTGSDVLNAMEGRVLGSASIVGAYTLNPALR